MAHNPPRIWITDAQIRDVERAIEHKRRQWMDLDELADRILARAEAGKNVVLSPGTAAFVAHALKGRDV